MRESDRYDSLFQFYAESRGVSPWEILKAIASVESSFNPRAVSPVGAVGLMQFIAPAWLDAIRFGAIPEDADRRNPEHSIAAAASYLAWLKQRFHEWMKVVAAYNAGPGTLARILSVNTPVSWESRLPQETRAYVARVAGEFKRLTGRSL